MITRSKTKTETLKDSASNASDIATKLARDKKFRKELAAAIAHGARVRRRARRRVSLAAYAGRIGRDPMIRREAKAMVKSLDKAMARFERKQSHKTRNSLLFLAGVGLIAAAPQVKKIAFGGNNPDK
jgi:hypothetical protein